MFPNTSTQSQHLFKDCLSFTRQLSQSPELYSRQKGKIRENSFNFQTGSPGKFPRKRKSPSEYKQDQRRRKHPGKGMPNAYCQLLVTMEQFLLLLCWKSPNITYDPTVGRYVRRNPTLESL